MQRATMILNQGLQLVHAALLTLALCLILVPATRAAPARVAFLVLWFSVACVDLHRLWRRGYLTKSPRQIYDTARAGQRFAATGLERASMLAAMVAMFFVLPWHA